MCYLTIPSTAITHNGCFSANDVFSAALLKCLNPQIKIIRASNVPDNFTGLVYGLRNTLQGCQNERKPVRRNRIPYASFGLLWRDYGRFLINNREGFRYFDDHFIQELDLAENYLHENSLTEMIDLFHPQTDEDEDKMFWQAESIAEKILKREIRHTHAWMEAKEEIGNRLKKQEPDDPILIMERSVPFQDLLAKTGIRFAIYPVHDGKWKASVIRYHTDGSDKTIYFPEEWAENDSLSDIVDGLLSCDRKGTFIITRDVQSAKEACINAINKDTGSRIRIVY